MKKLVETHTFHIPVMGLGFTIDTPIKVARYGISSVVSIMEDHLIEAMRKVICEENQFLYTPINTGDEDYRAKRITSYLNLMDHLIKEQIKKLKTDSFESSDELNKYFKLLPDSSVDKLKYNDMIRLEPGLEKVRLQNELKSILNPGQIDVNIMTKLDKINYNKSGEAMPIEYSDALSALRGFCESNISSSVIFSAGMNPRLYTYCEQFEDFYPNELGIQRKKIVLKVSDYRSALIQGKIFAKKGILVTEFRIESGLNCGGHAFATQGFLLGPILEEFKTNKDLLFKELIDTCNSVLTEKDKPLYSKDIHIKITAQGGIGTSQEDQFLMNYYQLDGTGWGSPFLLVPETTNVDDKTLYNLTHAKEEDFYLSNSSPLGVRFHNFRKSSSEDQRRERINKNRPGSPCYKEFLVLNTEFTEKPICTASRQYQSLKINEIEKSDFNSMKKAHLIEQVLEKECLCEGLGSSALITNNAPLSHKLSAVSICPGPNLAFFNRTYKLNEMVDHIYGRFNLILKNYRPHMFINEAKLYIDYLNKEIDNQFDELTLKQKKYFEEFKLNLEKGLAYYDELTTKIFKSSIDQKEKFQTQLTQLKLVLSNILIEKSELSKI